MKKIKICTPVIGKTLKEFLENLDQVQEVSDMVELKVDKIKNLSKKDLILIRKKTKKETIFTSRQKKIILQAIDLGFDYVDVKLSLIPKLNLSKRNKNKIILSFHDFKKTPKIKKLTSIINHMREYKMGVIKIATLVNNDQSIRNLMRILLNKRKNEKMIIVGMGEKGKITRILGPLFGSFLTFASTQFGSSAPGQIEIMKLKKIYQLIN